MELPISVNHTPKRRFGADLSVSTHITPAKLLRELDHTFKVQSVIKPPTFSSIVDLVNRTSFGSVDEIQKIEKFLLKRSEKLKSKNFHLAALSCSVANYIRLLYSPHQTDRLSDVNLDSLKTSRNDYLVAQAKPILDGLIQYDEQLKTPVDQVNDNKIEPIKSDSLNKPKFSLKNIFRKAGPTDTKTNAVLIKPKVAHIMPKAYCVETMTQFCVSCANDPACSDMILKYFKIVDPSVPNSRFAFATHLKILISTIESIALNHPYRLLTDHTKTESYDSFVNQLCVMAVNWLNYAGKDKYPNLSAVKGSLSHALEVIEDKRTFSEELREALLIAEKQVSN